MIGVVGGVGPYAGLDLLTKILEQTIATADQDHLPVAALFDPAPIPDRTAFLLGEIALNPATPILEQLRKLEQMGATVAGIPCNTAHAPPIFDPIRRGLQEAGSRLLLLHMIAEVGHALAEEIGAPATIGLLATTGTVRSNVYNAFLEPLGLRVILPSRDLQEEAVHPAIYDPAYGLKAAGRATGRAVQDLFRALRQLQQGGAQAVVLGCTELPLAITGERIDDVRIIDPALILARALIKAVAPAKLRDARITDSDSKRYPASP